MKVLVTGASAYAGFHAALALATAGHEVHGLTRKPGNPRLNMLRQHEVGLIEADVGRPETYRGLIERCDVVLHAMIDYADPQGTDDRLIEAVGALPERPGHKRTLIYTTGCSIYGKVSERVMDEGTPGNPDHALAWRFGMERKVLALGNVRRIVLRPGFMYGRDGHSSVSAQWFEMGEKGEPVFRGDRGKGWSWVHIADLAEAYRLAAEAGAQADGEVFCLADEQRPRCVDVMRACLRAAGCEAEVRFEGPADDDVTSTWFDQDEFITSAKARRLLGWAPRHAGVLDAVEACHAAWKAAREG